MLKSSLCDYCDACVLVSVTIIVAEAGSVDAAKPTDKNNKQAIFRKCAPFTNFITEINNTQVDNANSLDVAMPICKLMKFSDTHSKKFELYINFPEISQIML